VYVNAGTLKRSRITGNVIRGSTYERGAGLYMNGGTVENCLIVSNVTRGQVTSDDGPAVYLNAGTMRNCTVAGNSTTNHQYAGIYRAGGTATNTLVYGNVAVRSGYTSAEVNTTNGFAYSCAPELTNGEGNVTGNPQFKDVAAGDYSILGSSSCFNAGTNGTWVYTSPDLNGEQRVRYQKVDIGCFENFTPPGTVFLFR